jgi:hypothetical protein
MSFEQPAAKVSYGVGSSDALHVILFCLQGRQDGALASFPDAVAAQGAPLAEALIAISGVKMVDVSGAVVAVVKTDDSN